MNETDLLTFIRQKNLQRFNVDPQIASQRLDSMGSWIATVESDQNPQAVNPKSSARGLYQYTKDSLNTALNRLQNTIGRDQMPDWAIKARSHKDASRLSPDQQKILFEVDTFQKKGSDQYLKNILQGNEQAVVDLYRNLHHTNTDAATEKRIEKLLPQLDLQPVKFLTAASDLVDQERIQIPELEGAYDSYQLPSLASDLVRATPVMKPRQAQPKQKPTPPQDAPDNYIPGFLEAMQRALGLK